MNPVQCSLIGLAIASINHPHMELLAQQGLDIEDYQKLLQKQRSYLSGELKSEANLLRFFAAFSDWRQQQDFNDTLNDQIADLCCAALYSSIEMLHDPECDDTELLFGYLSQIHDVMSEMGAETDSLRTYTQEFRTELHAQIDNLSQRPVNKAFFSWLRSFDASLFGLSN